ncbi:hepatic lectin-like [Mytilus edulis]|uniref:hepatic lectin-like n=1 Tax=Mytilus edulis TaxID=6550 RepID=UPI0039EE9D1F
MANDKLVSISLLFFVRFSPLSGNIETIEISENLNLRDKFSEYNNLGNIESKSLVRCTNICLLTASCRSLFYQRELHQCILHSLDIPESSVNLVSSTGWKYYKTVEESPSTTQSTSPADKCTSTAGFIYNAGESMCYFIGSPIAVDFDVIETLCSNMNSELIRIDSAQKQAFVQQILAADAGSWVCIQGDRDDGSYKFDDGSDMTYFNWNMGQPDNFIWHHIVMVKQFNYLWHDMADEKLDRQCTYICEK